MDDWRDNLFWVVIVFICTLPFLGELALLAYDDYLNHMKPTQCEYMKKRIER